MEKTIRLLAAAGVLMLLAGALGCLAAALNFRGKAKDAHQHEDEQV